MSEEHQAKLIAFLKSLLHPEEFGWAVTEEVRAQAMELLHELSS